MKKEGKKKRCLRSDGQGEGPSKKLQIGSVFEFFISEDHKEQRANFTIKKLHIKKRRTKVLQKDQSVSFFLPENFINEE